jgi:hypothetical protein
MAPSPTRWSIHWWKCTTNNFPVDHGGTEQAFDGKLELAIAIFNDQYPKKFLHQPVSGNWTWTGWTI